MLWLGGQHPDSLLGLVADSDGGARIGLIRFIPSRTMETNDPIRIVLKPSQMVTVRVKDAAGVPVAGALIEIFDFAFQNRGHDRVGRKRERARSGRRPNPVGNRPQIRDRF